MAEAERITGTPGTPEAPGAAPEQSRADSVHGEPRTEEPLAEERPAPDEHPAPDEPAAAGPSAADEPHTCDELPSEGQPSDDVPQPRGPRRVAVLFAVAAVAYLLDVVSKVLVVAKLEHHDSVELLGDWLRLEAIRNPGAAFSMGQAYTVIFTVIAAVVIFVIVRLSRKLYSPPWAVALGLLLGGALGNLTDRLFRSPGVFEGAVVDFIAPKGFAVFNLADSAIVCGGVLIVLLSFRGLDPDGTVHRD